MNKRVKVFLLLLSGFFVLAGITYWGYQRVLDKRQALNSPPSVQIQWPQAGYRTPPNSQVMVQVNAWSSAPISWITIWLDGQATGQSVNSINQAGAYAAQFEVNIGGGDHILTARAADTNGRVGQALPMAIHGDPSQGSGDVLLKYPTIDETTINDLAGELGMNPDNLQDANPGFGNATLPPGTIVDVPVDLGDPQPVDQVPDFPAPAPAFDTPPGQPPLPTVTGILKMYTSWVNLLPVNVPAAPDGLQARVENCKLVLRWNDNADSEDYYRVWMMQLGQPGRVIADVSSSPHTGPVWMKSDAPAAGMYSFWVESVNKIGNQPSDVVSIGVPYDSTCPSGIATQLQVDVVGINVSGSYNKVYCYVSLEGMPEKRFPSDDSVFISSVGGQATYLYKGGSTFALPLPGDQILNLEGKCMGSTGGPPDDLGIFGAQIPINLWDGSDQVIESANYRIKVRVKPLGSIGVSSGVYSTRDLTLPVPYDLEVFEVPVFGGGVKRGLLWEWNGDHNEITGFTVYLNGNPFKTTSDQVIPLDLPPDCGVDYGFQVVANTTDAESEYSDGVVFSSTPCQLNAIVEFQILYIAGDVLDKPRMFQGLAGPNATTCDGYQAQFFIFSKGTEFQARDFPKSSFHIWPLNCNGSSKNVPGIPFSFSMGYPFSMLTEGENVFISAIDPNDPKLRFGTVFWDSDDNGKDIICAFDISWDKNTYSAQEWKNLDYEEYIPCGYDTLAYVKMHIRGTGATMP